MVNYENTSEPSQRPDPELAAMTVIFDALRVFDYSQRVRIMAYIDSRYPDIMPTSRNHPTVHSGRPTGPSDPDSGVYDLPDIQA